MNSTDPETGKFDPSNRLLATALAATSQPMLITSRDGSILWVNAAFADLTGYTSEELIGQNPRILKSGHFDADYYRRMWEALMAGKVWSGEFVNRRKGGTFYYAAETITPVRSDSGDITHFVGSVVDLTQRRAREQEIARLNRLYATLSEVNQAVVHVRSQPELFERTCRAVVELGGFTLAWIGCHEPLTHRIRAVAKAGVGSGALESLSVSYDAGQPRSQGPAATALGEGRPVIVNDLGEDERACIGPDRSLQDGMQACAAFPIRSEGQAHAVLSVYGADPSEFAAQEVRLLTEVADDVSFALDRLTAETRRVQIEDSHRRLATIVETSDDAIVSRDLGGTILSWNTGAEKIYGYSAAEIVGRSQSILVPSDRAEEIRAIDARLRRGEFVPTFETVRRRKEGREIDVAVTVSALRDDQGAIIGAATIARDITEQKKLMAQFLRAQRLESVGELAGGIAHDLNNVLAPIRLAVPLLRSEVSPGHAQNLLDIMEASAGRGAQIIRQILNFARGTEGAQVRLQTRHLVQELAEMLEQTLSKSIHVEGSFPRDLWPVEGDPTQLHQLFMNLCLNARDAMPHGGVLTICGENVEFGPAAAEKPAEAELGRYVIWTVGDTGAGIAPKDLAKIFEPFFTTKEPGKGTGLGLSTALKIARNHHGFIQVKSRLGTGTQFRVHLPAVDSEAPRPSSAHPLLPNGHGELVLLVDDEYSVRQVIGEVLQAHGYRVLSASDGLQAQSSFREHAPEVTLLITDLAMPGMSGTELIKLLRGLEPELKVIAMSGVVERRESGAAAVNLFADSFLPKPFSIDELLTTIAALLKKER